MRYTLNARQGGHAGVPSGVRLRQSGAHFGRNVGARHGEQSQDTELDGGKQALHTKTNGMTEAHLVSAAAHAFRLGLLNCRSASASGWGPEVVGASIAAAERLAPTARMGPVVRGADARCALSTWAFR